MIRPVRSVFLLVGWLLATVGVRAGDAAFEALFAQKAWDRAEADARARLATDAGDLEAANDLARVIVEGNRGAKMEEAVTLLDRVIAHEPDVARHHWHLGQAFGALARRAGLGGLSLAGRSRRELARAVEIEPASFTYVFALNEFYLEAPAIAGGSVAKARAAAQAFEDHDHDCAALLSARVLIYEEKFKAAREAIATVAGRDVAEVNIVRRNLLTAVGNGFLDDRKNADALALFDAVATEFPNNAAAQLGLGRARFAAGDAEGALTALERSRALGDNAEVCYRLGQVHQARGEIEAARSAYRASLERKATGRNADDARRRLAALGG